MRTELHASYSAFSRAVHWLTLVLFVGLFLIGWFLDDLPQEMRPPTLQLHKSFGITVLALTVLRLIWRFAAGVPPMPADLPAWQKLAARAAQYALYGLLLAQPLVGWLWSSAATKPINFYFLGQLPWLIGPDKQLSRTLAGLHGTIAWALLVLIAIHAAAALYHHFVRRDRVLLAMVGGGAGR
ncbi:MAG TPA: cytochrome b [Aliidongia sp.]|uniref:cytochrome b n=1 Tax=Aliidongia sp. TaxID=1914230 RepID=UPI002DDD8FE7|nr:cytochrome b [Aliidongia sp.]HEV2675696.1 cytochrome b [Aliidongia sp.]